MTTASEHRPVTIFFAGDVMTGRGVDQILPHPSDPELRESYVTNARGYVALAGRLHGPVPDRVAPSYIWGDALSVLERVEPCASIINLETSITTSSDFWPAKAVHYRMHPDNVGCLQAVPIDVCALANNHVLDFGRSGLLETLDVLRSAGIQGAGAGRNLEEASRPARLELPGGAALQVFGLGSVSSGIPPAWAAQRSHSGVHLLADLSATTADHIAHHIRSCKQPGDLAVASIHWGSNWGFEVSRQQVSFAQQLVRSGIDVVHGHSSHHVRPIEIYEGKLILYGCGDLLTDYEGIQGNEAWRGDIGALYLATLSSRDGTLVELRLFPTKMKQLRLTRAGRADVQWLEATLNRISRPFGSCFAAQEDDSLVLCERA